MAAASDGSRYPLLTPLNTNQAGAVVGQLSLRLTGPAGTYAQLLRGWLEVKRRGTVVKQALRLSVLDLARLLSRAHRAATFSHSAVIVGSLGALGCCFSSTALL